MNRIYDFSQPIIFAHRGASSYAPENTLAAFEKAVEMGAEAIELDVKLSKDGEVIVIHDHTLERTTNGSGKVNSCTLAELKKLDAGSHFSSTFSGEHIPTLSEVFSTVGKHIYINIELTNYTTPFDPLPQKVAQLVLEHQQQENILFSSFHFITLFRIRRLLPDIPVAILASSGAQGILARSGLGSWLAPGIIHPHYKFVTPNFIRKERGSGRRVHVWTVNAKNQMINLFQFGVNGIFTDDPLLAIRCRDRK